MWVINNDRIWLEPWRFIGYGFVHNSANHLIFNAAAQLFFGLPLELSNGSKRIAYVYLSGILLAGLGRELTGGLCSDKPLAGASGKILCTSFMYSFHSILKLPVQQRNKVTFYSIVGGMYALVGAHLAQLVLNWENDSFAMRQRMNFCGMKDVLYDSRPPAVLPASRFVRWFRLILALVVLGSTLKPLPSCEDVEIDRVSHHAHLFGALSGILSGCIFLKVRTFTKQMRYIRNFLKYVFWFIILLVVLRFVIIRFKIAKDPLEEDQNYCPWFQYEKLCQDLCYQMRTTNKTKCTETKEACGFTMTCGENIC